MLYAFLEMREVKRYSFLDEPDEVKPISTFDSIFPGAIENSVHFTSKKIIEMLRDDLNLNSHGCGHYDSQKLGNVFCFFVGLQKYCFGIVNLRFQTAQN